jgi:hypothetical protein
MALTKMLIFYAAGVPCFGMVDLIAVIILLKTDGVCGMKLKWEHKKPTHFYLWIDPPFILLIISNTYSLFQGENDTNVPKWSKRYVCEKLKS